MSRKSEAMLFAQYYEPNFPHEFRLAMKLLLTITTTTTASVAETSKILPAGASLVSGDAIIPALLEWQLRRTDRPFTTTGQAYEAVLTDCAPISEKPMKTSFAPLPYSDSTESKECKAPLLVASTSKPPLTTETRGEIPHVAHQDSARHDPIDSKTVKAASVLLSSSHVQSILTTMLHTRSSGFVLFEKELARMLRDLGRSLAIEGGEGPLADAAEILQSEQGSNDTASEVLGLAYDLRPGEPGRDFFSGSGHVLKPSSKERSKRGGLAAVSESTAKGDAQLSFERELLHCAHSSYENRLCSISAGATLVGQSGTYLSPSKSLSVIR